MEINRKMSLAWAGLLAMGVGLVGVGAPVDAAGPGIVASATGSGHFFIGEDLRTFAFTARTSAGGETKGEATVNNRSQGIVSHLKIDCLDVSGNIATMAGYISASSNPDIVGQYAIFRVVDNGEGGKAASPDLLSLVFFRVSPPYDCTLDYVIALNPVARGNIQVH